VYSKAGEKFDPQKKGGRYKPEFIWNTNWQEQLKIQEDLEKAAKEYKEKQAAGASGPAPGPGECLLLFLLLWWWWASGPWVLFKRLCVCGCVGVQVCVWGGGGGEGGCDKPP
jgi:hypothetical protein